VRDMSNSVRGIGAAVPDPQQSSGMSALSWIHTAHLEGAGARSCGMKLLQSGRRHLCHRETRPLISVTRSVCGHG